ncbi:hypothetical protein TSOC_002791 [Tetrabaena socialis]|uniref:Uncharacterized protein n=1 Tax=Tetrabaena socialis TaxID=47790 RepID=A0A2J8AD91_9CHLO|nr:hypothetical protein TSOC_002791 [Tetrabaena socialis]|eukprot:PNH10477.1 hypothetical protein TSOC_002791 [Tetrabaena socialis]
MDPQLQALVAAVEEGLGYLHAATKLRGRPEFRQDAQRVAEVELGHRAGELAAAVSAKHGATPDQRTNRVPGNPPDAPPPALGSTDAEEAEEVEPTRTAPSLSREPPTTSGSNQTPQPAQPAQGQPPQPAQPAQGQPAQPAQEQPPQPAQGQPPQPAQPAQGQPAQPAQGQPKVRMDKATSSAASGCRLPDCRASSTSAAAQQRSSASMPPPPLMQQQQREEALEDVVCEQDVLLGAALLKSNRAPTASQEDLTWGGVRYTIIAIKIVVLTGWLVAIGGSRAMLGYRLVVMWNPARDELRTGLNQVTPASNM